MKGAQLFFFIIGVFFVGSTLGKPRGGKKGLRRSIGLNELHSLGEQLTANEKFTGPFEEGLMDKRGDNFKGTNYWESTLKGKKKKKPTSKNKG